MPANAIKKTDLSARQQNRILISSGSFQARSLPRPYRSRRTIYFNIRVRKAVPSFLQRAISQLGCALEREQLFRE